MYNFNFIKIKLAHYNHNLLRKKIRLLCTIMLFHQAIKLKIYFYSLLNN